MKTPKLNPTLAAALNGCIIAGPPMFQPHVQGQVDTLRDQMLELHERAAELRAQASRTPADDAELQRLDAEFNLADAEVKRIEALSRPNPRRVPPADLDRQHVTGGYAPGASRSTWGWESPGHFAAGVIAAARGRPDPRLTAAATTYGSEGTNADGGYAVPPDFRQEIQKTLQGEQSLLALTDQQISMSNKLTVPVDNTTPWQTSGGVLAMWEVEAADLTPSKPALDHIECPLNKLSCLVPLSDELLEDAPALSRYLPGKIADKFTSKLNDAIVNGDGAGKPSGLLDSGALLEVDIEDTQDLDSPLLFANVTKMWNGLYAPLRQGAVWLINQDLERAMMTMTVPGTQPAYPAYLPPNGLSVKPYATLMGAPVIPIQACQAVGTPGDLILTNLKQYLSVVKASGMRQDFSMHAYFSQDLGALRVIMRVGGQTWWSQKATRPSGGDVSSVVVLGERTGGS